MRRAHAQVELSFAAGEPATDVVFDACSLEIPDGMIQLPDNCFLNFILPLFKGVIESVFCQVVLQLGTSSDGATRGFAIRARRSSGSTRPCSCSRRRSTASCSARSRATDGCESALSAHSEASSAWSKVCGE